MNITTKGFRVVVTKNRKIYLEQRYEKKAPPGEWLNEPPYDWKRIGNYQTLESACRALLNAKLMASDASDTKAILQRIEEAQQEIERAVRRATAVMNRLASKQIQSGERANFG